MTPIDAVIEGSTPTSEADRLLAIQEPEQLFTDPGTLASEFRALARRWHPDTQDEPRAVAVFAHLAELRDRGLRTWATGLWDAGDTLWFREGTDVPQTLPVRSRRRFELGREFVCSDCLATWVDGPCEDFLRQADQMTRTCRFSNTRMQAAFEDALPRLRAAVSLPDGSHVLIQELAPDLIRLRDLLAWLRGPLDGRHTAWIVSGLLNLACYLEHAELTHNDLSLDTCFVSPVRHFVALPGAWWFGAVEGSPLLGVPSRTLAQMPPWLAASGHAHRVLDLEQIRAVARELLGDATGQRFPSVTPEAMATWSRLATSGSAREDYREWMQEVLPESYGARRFVALEITPEQVYGGKA